MNCSEQTDDFDWAKYPVKANAPFGLRSRAQNPTSEGFGWIEAIRCHEKGFVSGLRATRHTVAVARRYAELKVEKSIQSASRADSSGMVNAQRYALAPC